MRRVWWACVASRTKCTGARCLSFKAYKTRPAPTSPPSLLRPTLCGARIAGALVTHPHSCALLSHSSTSPSYSSTLTSRPHILPSHTAPCRQAEPAEPGRVLSTATPTPHPHTLPSHTLPCRGADRAGLERMILDSRSHTPTLCPLTLCPAGELVVQDWGVSNASLEQVFTRIVAGEGIQDASQPSPSNEGGQAAGTSH